MTSEGTAERVLRLLFLLQRRPMWRAAELAAELGVTARSIRRDVERLRALGYPVRAAAGVGGGYQLGSGARMPPLLLDDEEAIATAMALRLGAGGTVAGAGEAAPVGRHGGGPRLEDATDQQIAWFRDRLVKALSDPGSHVLLDEVTTKLLLDSG
ncbi:HTH domain-containing protein, partial [Rothia sp. AR01]